MKQTLLGYRSLLLITLGAVCIDGCAGPRNSDDEPDISIRFSAATHDSYRFELLNAGDRKVAIYGWKRDDGEITPQFSRACSADSSYLADGGILAAPSSLPIDSQRTFEIPPSSSLSLVIQKSDFGEQVGDHCFITVLIGNHAVHSDEFEP